MPRFFAEDDDGGDTHPGQDRYTQRKKAKQAHAKPKSSSSSGSSWLYGQASKVSEASLAITDSTLSEVGVEADKPVKTEEKKVRFAMDMPKKKPAPTPKPEKSKQLSNSDKRKQQVEENANELLEALTDSKKASKLNNCKL
ncbi:MAG: hypothetical protein MHPSP_004423 [Paramarteilia canceri]